MSTSAVSAVPTYRGFLNVTSALMTKQEMQKSKGFLSGFAQNYFKDTTRPHSSRPNTLIYKLDNTGYVCFDTDDKASNDFIMSVMEKYNVPANRNKSVSNAFTPTIGENANKFHYWFKTDKKYEKLIGTLNPAYPKLDLLTKEIVFEPIVEGMFQIQDAPMLTDEIYKEIKGVGATALFPVQEEQEEEEAEEEEADEEEEEEADEPQEVSEADTEAKEFIDSHTTPKDAKTYTTWRNTMFKIYNKYGRTALGLRMAKYFSSKDKKKYVEADVALFWNKIDAKKIAFCEFGLTEIQLKVQKEEMRRVLFETIEQDKLEKKKLKEQQQLEKQKKMEEEKNQKKTEKKTGKDEQDEQKRKKNESNEEKALSSYKDAFKKMKEEFEKENFKVVQNSCFVQETFDENNNRKLIQRNTTELTVAFSHLIIKYKGWEDDKEVEKAVPFVPMWIKCEDILRYDRMDCYPNMSKCPPTCFNIWTPFEMERYNDTPLVDSDEVRTGVAFLRHHMSIMCDHEADTLLEFEKWLAQMIQFPEFKSHMPIFQSAEGSGKGSFFSLLKKILGVSKVFETESPEEYVWGRFNNMMETTFLVVMNEISKQMTNGGMDKIKGIIDGEHIQIQHKGKGAYPMKSFHRFAGCTNAWDGGMTINKGSRRFLMCKMSDEKKGVMEYWTTFRALLENVDVLRGFYNYYKTMQVNSVLPAPMKTEFAKELEKLSVDVPTLWVKDLVADAKVNKTAHLAKKFRIAMVNGMEVQVPYEYKTWNNSGVEEYVIELSGKRACELLMEWCKENGYSRYETTPIKLGVFLKTKKWAGLIKGRSTNTSETRYYRVQTLIDELKD
jgi:hypothetical protein